MPQPTEKYRPAAPALAVSRPHGVFYGLVRLESKRCLTNLTRSNPQMTLERYSSDHGPYSILVGGG
jgi:hypothetical protein